MKVKDYLPLYGLFFNFEYFTAIDGKRISLNELFENYPDFELNDTYLNQLYLFDNASLVKVLKHEGFNPKNVIGYLRDLFDDYRQNGGDPIKWLDLTHEMVNLYPYHFRSDLIGIIEQNLLIWMETFYRQPNDYLFESSVYKEIGGNEIENKFNQMPMEEVRQHFKQLTEKKNPKKKVWMTNEDFDIFLRRSFGGETDLPKPKITLGHGAKYALVKLFYQFYDKCQIEHYNQNRNKDPFLNLLKEAFSTKEFDDLDTSNFKDSNSKYEWN